MKHPDFQPASLAHPALAADYVKTTDGEQAARQALQELSGDTAPKVPTPAEVESDDIGSKDRRTWPEKLDQLVDDVEFFHSPDEDAYATFAADWTMQT